MHTTRTHKRLPKAIHYLAAGVFLFQSTTASLHAQSVPVIDGAATASGKVGNAFSYQITATNAPTQYRAGSLPQGLSVNKTTGLVSGTITGIDGSYNATLYALNATGTGSKKLPITVAPTVPVITATAIPVARKNTAFSFQIPATNFPRSYGVSGLPAGFALNPTTGVISGSTATLGNWTLTLTATNGAGTATKVLAFKILPLRPVITSNSAAAGKVQATFAYQITATNTPTSFAATGLPAGLSLNTTTGLISGKPTAIDGIYNATLSATNSGGTGSNPLVLTVAPTLPVITSNASATSVVNAAFTYRITASNFPRTIGVSALPPGLTYNATSKTISGTPTAVGNRTITLTATNGAGTATKSLAFQCLPMPPVIGGAATASGKVGNAFSYQITATNAPTQYRAGSLPQGLSVNKTTGLVSGTITGIDGSYNATLYALNATGTGSKKLPITVAPTVPVITATAIPVARKNTAFSFQIPATNFPRSYGVSGLPAGFALNSTTGVISGSTATLGNWTLTLTATNGAGTATKVLAFKILPLGPVITSNGAATGKVQETFAYQITATNTPTSFAATGLPAGLSLNTTTGLISGKPTAIDGIYNATLSATNLGGTDRNPLVLTVAPTLPVITSSASATGVVNAAFTYRITASNFPRNIGISALMPGLTWNATSKTISGTPTAVGNRTITLTAINGAGTATKSLQLSITPPPGVTPPRITTSSIPLGRVDQAYNNTPFTASGGSGLHTWSVVQGLLPKEMTLNATTGILSGTPTQSGIYSFIVRVTDALRQQDELEVVLAVENPQAGTVVKDIFSVLPAGSALTQSPGNATCSFNYQPSGSTWIEGVSEEDVFFASMNSSSGWRLGIGKGGQVYSLRGSFGEAIPPQRVDAPWVDEAWQFVATSLRLVSPVHEFQSQGSEERRLGFPIQFFIHQSGIYRGGLAGNSLVGSPTMPFYSPILKKHWNPATRTLSLVSWSQMARSPNVWKSGMLTYASYRDLGNGAIEVTNFVTNFGDQDLTFINTPWGGTRPSTFPETVLSQRGGTWRIASQGSYGSNTPIFARDTDGWQAWVQNSTQEESDSLAVVFGNQPLPTVSDQEWRGFHTILTYGLTHVGRDYAVSSIQNNIQLQAGRSLACRWHLVLGPFGQTRIKASALAGHAGLWMPRTDASVLTPVWTTAGTPSSTGEGAPSLHLYAQPLPGAVPVFAMEDTRTGRVFATLDPYELCPTAPYPNPLPASHWQFELYQNRVVYYQYNSPGVLRELLGYAFTTQPPVERDIRVSLPGANGPLFLWAPPLVTP